MSLQLLLEDWKEYDDRKIRDRRDAKDFACTESWEVDYLVRKFRKVYPSLTEVSIRSAISACCSQTKPPHPRQPFVNCVKQRLGV